MKTIKITALFILAVLLTGNLFAQQITVPLTDPGKSYKLDLHLVDGAIKVTGYDGKDIIVDVVGDSARNSGARVNVNVNVGNKSEEGGNSGMRRINGGGGIDVSATEKNNNVNISSGFIRKPIIVTVKVPVTAGSEYKIGTVNGGDVTINNLNGTLEVNNVNGQIVCTNISGSVVANTVNGKVQVTFKSIDSKAAMAFSTLNGNVDVTLPADTKANLKVKSDRGDVFTDFDMTVDQTKPKSTVTNEGNMHRIAIEDWVYGKINGGGPEFMMKNMQGNIYIRKAK